MKLTLNGALTIGTLDGANVEIRVEARETRALPRVARSKCVRTPRW